MHDAFDGLRRELEAQVAVPPFSVIRRRRAARVHTSVAVGSMAAVAVVAVGTVAVLPAPAAGRHASTQTSAPAVVPPPASGSATKSATPATTTTPVPATSTLESGPSYPPAGPGASFADSPLPLDAYRESPADMRTVSIAETTLWNACRTRYGLPGSIRPYLALHNDTFRTRFTNVADAATARTYGYHQPDLVGAAATTLPAQPTRTTTDNLVDFGTLRDVSPPDPQATQRVVNGQRIPAGGCFNEALRSLGEPTDKNLTGSDYDYATELQSQTTIAAMQDSTVLAARQAWTTCMHSAGYPVNTFAPAGINYSKPPTRAEIAQALTDVTCQHDSNLQAISQAAAIRYESSAVAAHHRRLEAARVTWQTWVSRAEAAVPGSDNLR